MKNKQYRVWMTQCYSVDIDAKEISDLCENCSAREWCLHWEDEDADSD